jgi:hypothetical protein
MKTHANDRLLASCAISLACLLFVAVESHAQPVCKAFSSVHVFYQSHHRRPYKIHEGLVNRTDDNLTAQQVITAIQSGAEYWNHEANSGVFEYDGTHTSYTGYWPATECASINRDWGNVYKTTGSYSGIAAGDCCWGAGYNCDSFRIGITQHVQSFRSYVDVMAHEFGHTFDLGHPANGEYALMCNSVESNCYDNGQARLREYDIVCAREKGGHAYNRKGYYRVQYANGSFGPHVMVPYNQDWLRRVGSVPAFWTFDFVNVRNDSLRYMRNFGSSYTFIWPSFEPGEYFRDVVTPTGAGFISGSFATGKYVFVKDYRDPVSAPGCSGGMFGAGCDHKRLQHISSFNDFSSTIQGAVKICEPTSVSQPFNCSSGDDPISTYRKLEIARFPGAPPDPLYEVSDTDFVFYLDVESKIRWAVGPVSMPGNTMYFAFDAASQPAVVAASLGLPVDRIRSRVKPAFACSEDCGQSGVYQCKLAFVPRDDNDGRIHFWNFKVRYVLQKSGMIWVPVRYGITWDSTGPQRSGAYYFQTAGDLAFWETAGYFYLGFKRDNWEQRTKIYRKQICSNDMLTGWTHVDDTFGWTDDGLSVSRLDDGLVVLTYTRTEM